MICQYIYAIKHAEKYAIKYVKYATTFTDMQNMWIKKYAKYVAYAKNVKRNENNIQYNMLKICINYVKYATTLSNMQNM